MKKLLLALALCSIAIPSFGDDFSKSINKDLARQCYYTMVWYASEQYSIILEYGYYPYIPAVRMSKKNEAGEHAVAGILITVKILNEDEEFSTLCYFNGEREVIQFGDPWDLRVDSEHPTIEKIITNPRRRG